MALFSPYDVERVYGKPFADISVTEEYDRMVADERIRKTWIDARQFFMTLPSCSSNPATPTWYSRTRSTGRTRSKGVW